MWSETFPRLCTCDAYVAAPSLPFTLKEKLRHSRRGSLNRSLIRTAPAVQNVFSGRDLTFQLQPEIPAKTCLMYVCYNRFSFAANVPRMYPHLSADVTYGAASSSESVFVFLRDSDTGILSAGIQVAYSCMTSESSSHVFTYMVSRAVKSSGRYALPIGPISRVSDNQPAHVLSFCLNGGGEMGQGTLLLPAFVVSHVSSTVVTPHKCRSSEVSPKTCSIKMPTQMLHTPRWLSGI